MILDGELVRRRRAELALSSRALARQLGVSSAVISSLEAGTNHDDITLSFAQRLADRLAVDLTDLFATASQAISDTEDVQADARALGAALSADGTLVPLGALCEALGWTLERLEAAIEHLATVLPPAGLRLHHLQRQVSIVRAADEPSRPVLETLMRKHLHRSAISLAEGRMIYRVASGTPPREASNPERVAIGVLTNAGLLDFDPASSAEPVLSADVRYSLMLEEHPLTELAPTYRGHRSWREANRRTGRQATRGMSNGSGGRSSACLQEGNSDHQGREGDSS